MHDAAHFFVFVSRCNGSVNVFRGVDAHESVNLGALVGALLIMKFVIKRRPHLKPKSSQQQLQEGKGAADKLLIE